MPHPGPSIITRKGYINEKGKEISEAEILAKLETLGNDQAHLLTLLENLTEHFGPTLIQISTMAQFNMPEEGLQKALFSFSLAEIYFNNTSLMKHLKSVPALRSLKSCESS